MGAALIVLVRVVRMVVVRKHGVRNRAVRYELYRAAVVVELLLCDDVRVVAMHRAIYADNALYDARYGANVVRYHNYCHTFIELLK